MFPRLGEDSMTSHSKPSLVRFSARKFAAAVSLPGGLVVSIWIRLLSRAIASASISLSNWSCIFVTCR